MLARFCLIIAVVFAALPAWAAETVSMRAGAHPDHDRLVMDWGESVNYQLSGHAPDYLLSFTANAKAGIPHLGGLRRIADISQMSDAPLVLSIHLRPGNMLRISRAGNKLVLDAVKDPHPQVEAAKQPESKETKETAPPKALQDLEAGKNPSVKVAPWSENQDTGGAAPGAKKDEKIAEKPAEKPAEVTKGDTGPGGRPLTLAELAEQESQKQAQAAADKKALDAAATTDKDKDKPPEEPQAFSPLPTQLPEPTAMAQIKIKVPPNVKFAAYMRGKKFWVVLDQPNSANPTDEADQEPTKFGPVTRYQVGQGTGTAYRIQLGDNQFPAITKSDGGQLLFTVYGQMPLVMPVSLPITVENPPDTGPRLRIAGAGFAVPLRVSDPDVGDEVFVIPATADTGAVTEARRWPQIATIPALNGIVVDPLVDNVLVDANKDGALIARPPKGLIISGIQGLVRNRDKGMGERMFDLEKWRIGTFKSYRTIKAELESALADVRGSERLGRIMQIAQFMFAQGYGPEANGWLRLAAQEFPTVTSVPEYVLLRGAVHVTMHDIFAADKDLALPGYAYEPEVALWRGWAAAQHEDYSRARYFFSLARTLLQDYPDPYFKPIAFAAAETALITGDAVAGGALISRLEKRKDLDEADTGELDYLRALEARLNGREDEALRYWQRAAKSKNAIYAAKAELWMVQDGLKRKDMDKKEAIARLEKLRFNWRGDSTELGTLSTLADLYISDNNPRPAFEDWQTIIHYFPNEPLAEAARQNISKNFVTLFAPDQQNPMPPIEALALYRDFINYAPTPEVRDQITRQLTDKLVAVGMYHEAADVFATLVQAKSDASAVNPLDVLRLASIDLLDGNADAAHKALGLVPRAGLPPDQEAQHRLLAARADFQQTKYDDALQELTPLTDINAQRLRADIYWRKQDWANAAKMLPGLIGPIAVDGKLTNDQAKIILQEAVALSLANEADNLAALREKYSAQMDASEVAASFRLITRPPKGSELQSIKSIQSRLGEVDSFGEFLKNYQRPPSENKPDAKNADASTAPASADTKAQSDDQAKADAAKTATTAAPETPPAGAAKK